MRGITEKVVNAAKCVLVYATSDFSSVDRCNARPDGDNRAASILEIVEESCTFVDSMTWYAQYRVWLATGDPPAEGVVILLYFWQFTSLTGESQDQLA